MESKVQRLNITNMTLKTRINRINVNHEYLSFNVHVLTARDIHNSFTCGKRLFRTRQ